MYKNDWLQLNSKKKVVKKNQIKTIKMIFNML